MSERDLSIGMSAALTGGHVRPFLLIELEFEGSTDRFWSGPGTLSWNAQTWTGSGEFLTMSQVEETTELRAVPQTFTITGVDPARVAQALAQARLGKRAKCWLGCFAADGTIIADPHQSFDGRIDVPTLRVAADSVTITLSAESRLIDLQRSRERRYTHEDQQIEHPGDRGFEFVPKLKEWNGKWGRV